MHIIIWYMPKKAHETLRKQIESGLREELSIHDPVSFLFYAPVANDAKEIPPLEIYSTADWMTSERELEIKKVVANRCFTYCKEQSPKIQFGGFKIDNPPDPML